MWHTDGLVDLANVVDTQKSRYHPTAILASQYYNDVTKKRSVCYAPFKTAVLPFHNWNSLVEKAGYKMSDAPKTWDAFWVFFKPMQKKLRDQGMRGVYALGLGLQPTTTGPADGNNLFHHFLLAYGGNGIVTPDVDPSRCGSAGNDCRRLPLNRCPIGPRTACQSFRGACELAFWPRRASSVLELAGLGEETTIDAMTSARSELSPGRAFAYTEMVRPQGRARSLGRTSQRPT